MLLLLIWKIEINRNKMTENRRKKNTTTPSHARAQPNLFGLQPYLVVLLWADPLESRSLSISRSLALLKSHISPSSLTRGVHGDGKAWRLALIGSARGVRATSSSEWSGCRQARRGRRSSARWRSAMETRKLSTTSSARRPALGGTPAPPPTPPGARRSCAARRGGRGRIGTGSTGPIPAVVFSQQLLMEFVGLGPWEISEIPNKSQRPM